MKIFHFLEVDLKKVNHSKSRKIKLMICGSILVISFTVIGYRTISLASVNRDNITNILNKKIESRAFNSNLRAIIVLLIAFIFFSLVFLRNPSLKSTYILRSFGD